MTHFFTDTFVFQHHGFWHRIIIPIDSKDTSRTHFPTRYQIVIKMDLLPSQQTPALRSTLFKILENIYRVSVREYGWLMQLSILFQLYRDGQFYWWRKPKYPENTTDLPRVTDKLYHIKPNYEIGNRNPKFISDKHCCILVRLHGQYFS